LKPLSLKSILGRLGEIKNSSKMIYISNEERVDNLLSDPMYDDGRIDILFNHDRYYELRKKMNFKYLRQYSI